MEEIIKGLFGCNYKPEEIAEMLISRVNMSIREIYNFRKKTSEYQLMIYKLLSKEGVR